MAAKIETPKGFRDFLPEASMKRAALLEKIVNSLKLYGFEQLETPALEFAETLKGKYGEEEKLIFEFKDRGGRNVALRYDQTVPLARVVASYPQLPKPFKRYQTQTVWRADNPQKGRFREFLQVDFDIVGTESLIADSEILAAAIFTAEKLGFSNLNMRINDRAIFKGMPTEVIRIIDKLGKIGEVGVIAQLKRLGYDSIQAKNLLKNLRNSRPSSAIKEVFNYLKSLNVSADFYSFDPTLARGLDYYTGLIFELEIEGYLAGSVGGGGRYDDLIGLFIGKKVPSVGFSFGFDRLFEALSEKEKIPPYLPSAKCLVTIFSPETVNQSIELVTKLRSKSIPAEIFFEPDERLEKQLKYAASKGIPFVIILGPEEIKKNLFTLKNLKTGQQFTITEAELFKQLKS